uniref:C3HC-type domain-containing protein n=1 Tax=Panagrolaimus sp. PS1159 TaxID=55785 RepID=A0AC35G984_9BILA
KDYEKFVAPLKAFNEECPGRQRSQEHQEIGQESYMKRLESFNKFRGSWLNLPPKISPVELASHGWSVYNENTVKCKECNAFLSVKVESSSPGDFDEQKHAIKYISSQIRFGHDTRCFWHSKIILQLPDEDFNFREAFMLVKLSLRRHKDSPFEFSKTFNNKPILGEKMEQYLSLLLKEDEKACMLAFHGWLPDSSSGTNLSDGLKCRFCAARIGIDPYSMKMPFNPIKFHERYCPVRVNTVDYQENVLVRNMDDLNTSNNIVESLRGIQDYIDYYKSPSQENVLNAEAEESNVPTTDN